MLSTPGSLWPQPASSCDRFQTLDMLAQVDSSLSWEICSYLSESIYDITLLKRANACKSIVHCFHQIYIWSEVPNHDLLQLIILQVLILSLKINFSFFSVSASLYYIVLWSVKCCIIRQSHQTINVSSIYCLLLLIICKNILLLMVMCTGAGAGGSLTWLYHPDSRPWRPQTVW